MNKSQTPKCPRCGSKHLAVDTADNGATWQAHCNDCKKRFPYAGTTYFKDNEEMTCAICGKQRIRIPGITTDWRVIELDEQPFRICADHFPPDGAGQHLFARAYEEIISHLMGKLARHDA